MPTRGLLNVGNTCYINALLQALVKLPPFRKWVQDASADPNGTELARILQDVFIQLEGGNSLTPLELSPDTGIVRWVWDHGFAERAEDDSKILMETFIHELKKPNVFNRLQNLMRGCTNAQCIPHFIQCEEDQFFLCHLDRPTTTRSLIFNYRETDIPEHVCGVCNAWTEQRFEHRNIITAPEILIISINRCQDVFNKNTIPCKIVPILSIAIEGDNETEWLEYEFVASVNHYGDTIQTGHWATIVAEGESLWKYNDTVVVKVPDHDVENCCLVFYQRKQTDNVGSNTAPENVTPEVPPPPHANPEEENMEEEDSYSNFDGSSRNAPDSPQDIDDRSGQPYTFETDPDVFRFVHRHLADSQQSGIMKKFSLMFLVPIKAEGHDFYAKFGDCTKFESTVKFVLTYPGSSIRRRIISNHDYQKDFVLYEMIIYRKINYDDVYQWLSDMFVFYIMFTHMGGKDGLRTLEFVCDRKMRCLVAKAIILRWNKTEEYIKSFLPHFANVKPFCIGYCRDDCPWKNFAGHHGLSDVNPVRFARTLSTEDLDGMIKLRGNIKGLERHPLRCLLSHYSYIDPTDLLTNLQIMQGVLTETTNVIQSLRKATVYALVIVTPPRGEPKPSECDLERVVSMKGTKLYSYVGCTSYGPYRKSLFHPTSIQPSPVWEKLTHRSAVFLILSEEFPTLQDALSFEATVIESLKIQRDLRKVLGKRPLPLVLINKKSEIIHLSAINLRLRQEIMNYVTNNTPFFQLDGDVDVPEPPSIGNYRIIQEVVFDHVGYDEYDGQEQYEGDNDEEDFRG